MSQKNGRSDRSFNEAECVNKIIDQRVSPRAATKKELRKITNKVKDNAQIHNFHNPDLGYL